MGNCFSPVPKPRVHKTDPACEGVARAVAESSPGAVGAVVAPAARKEGDDIWRALCNTPAVSKQLPVIGVLRTVRDHYPPAMASVSDTNSYLYHPEYAVVAGLSFDDALQARPLTDAQLAGLREAVAALERKGAVAITADASPMLAYHAEVSRLTRLPVLLSALKQAPLLATVYAATQRVLVLCADEHVRDSLPARLRACGLHEEEVPRFVGRVVSGLKGFRAGSESAETTEAMVARLEKLVSSEMRKDRALCAVLLESHMLPAFADKLRADLGVAVFDNVTLVDLVHHGATDNPRFGVSFGTTKPAARVDRATDPAIGILRIDYTYPPAMGDAAHPESFHYRTPHATAKGLTFEAAQIGDPLTPEQHANMKAAVRQLERDPDLAGIAGDCGFLLNYQREAVALSVKAPCFISALLQVHLMAALWGPNGRILVLTADGGSLERNKTKLLKMCGITDDEMGRFLIAGCEDLPGFDAVAKGEKVDTVLVQPHVVALCEARKAADPSIAAILLECTELPPYADAIRHATGMVVLDVITLVDYFHQAVRGNPYYGIDWRRLAQIPAGDGGAQV